MSIIFNGTNTTLVPGVGRLPYPAYHGDEPYIFVSYAHSDAKLVFDEIKRFNESGYHVWYDEGISPGNEWTNEIAIALRNCRVFVVMITPASAVRVNVQNEINYALDEEIPVIAIHLKQTELPPGMKLRIGSVQAIMKHRMSEEEYEHKYIKAFNSYGLGGHGSGRKPKSHKKAIIAGAVAVAVAAGVTAAIMAIAKPPAATAPSVPAESTAVETTAAQSAAGSSPNYNKASLPYGNEAAKEEALKGIKALTDEARTGSAADAPVLLKAYETDDKVTGDTAYTYDNAIAALALISEKNQQEAAAILDAFVYAVEHDRYQAGRIRNAYAAGNIEYQQDGKESAKLPGWYDEAAQSWMEDADQVGCSTGSTSFAALAMLQYDNEFGGEKYLSAAKTLMDWVISECSDTGVGFTSGYDGWIENGQVTRYTYKTVEYNAVAYAAFQQLCKCTSDSKYKKAADSSLGFIQSMYSETDNRFFTGTATDGKTPNQDGVCLPAQVCSAMALGDDFQPYAAALDIVEKMKTPDGGYAYCLNSSGGWWTEGSAMTALVYAAGLKQDKADATMDALRAEQLDSGLFPTATAETLPTGVVRSDGTQVTLGNHPQLAPTAWFVLAANGFNPYSFD